MLKMVCWYGRHTGETYTLKSGTVDPANSRSKISLRPSCKEDVCKWSILVKLDELTKRWHVRSSDTHVQEHNHELQPDVTVMMNRRSDVPAEAKQIIRSLAASGLGPFDILRCTKTQCADKGLNLPFLSLGDITTLSKDMNPQDQAQRNATAVALSVLLNLQKADPNWVVHIR